MGGRDGELRFARSGSDEGKNKGLGRGWRREVDASLQDGLGIVYGGSIGGFFI